jgi:hypothetical protein
MTAATKHSHRLKLLRFTLVQVPILEPELKKITIFQQLIEKWFRFRFFLISMGIREVSAVG